MVWEQFKVLCRAVKVGKSKSGKYKNYWNILDDQGYSKMIEFENDVEEWEEINQIIMTKQTTSKSKYWPSTEVIEWSPGKWKRMWC